MGDGLNAKLKLRWLPAWTSDLDFKFLPETAEERLVMEQKSRTEADPMEAWEMRIKAEKAERLMKEAVLAANCKDFRKVGNAAEDIGRIIDRARRRLRTEVHADASVIPQYRRIAVAYAAVSMLLGPGSILQHVAEALIAGIDCHYGVPTEDTLVGIRARAFFFVELAEKLPGLPIPVEEIALRMKEYVGMLGEEIRFLDLCAARAEENKGDPLWDAVASKIPLCRKDVDEFVVKMQRLQNTEPKKLVTR